MYKYNNETNPMITPYTPNSETTSSFTKDVSMVGFIM